MLNLLQHQAVRKWTVSFMFCIAKGGTEFWIYSSSGHKGNQHSERATWSCLFCKSLLKVSNTLKVLRWSERERKWLQVTEHQRAVREVPFQGDHRKTLFSGEPRSQRERTELSTLQLGPMLYLWMQFPLCPLLRIWLQAFVNENYHWISPGRNYSSRAVWRL